MVLGLPKQGRIEDCFITQVNQWTSLQSVVHNLKMIQISADNRN